MLSLHIFVSCLLSQKKKKEKKKLYTTFKSQQLKSSLGARHLLTNRGNKGNKAGCHCATKVNSNQTV